ncbi:hypothetical protein, partial [Bacillus sp. JJ722]|uniref:hypothetical protein n=1 Tax=Bacillus sp. JJ722 TaxID=3122973 RepID=UPI002FFF5FED
VEIKAEEESEEIKAKEESAVIEVEEVNAKIEAEEVKAEIKEKARTKDEEVEADAALEVEEEGLVVNEEASVKIGKEEVSVKIEDEEVSIKVGEVEASVNTEVEVVMEKNESKRVRQIENMVEVNAKSIEDDVILSKEEFELVNIVSEQELHLEEEISIPAEMQADEKLKNEMKVEQRGIHLEEISKIVEVEKEFQNQTLENKAVAVQSEEVVVVEIDTSVNLDESDIQTQDDVIRNIGNTMDVHHVKKKIQPKRVRKNNNKKKFSSMSKEEIVTFLARMPPAVPKPTCKMSINGKVVQGQVQRKKGELYNVKVLSGRKVEIIEIKMEDIDFIQVEYL